MSDEAVVEETNQNSEPELELDLSDEDTQDTEETKAEVSEDVNALKAELAKKQKEIDKLYARYKNEKEAKQEIVKKPISNSGLTREAREEAILFAKGHTEEEVELANKLAKVSGTNLLVAAEDPYFKSKVQERLKKEKSEQASIGASKGGGKFVPKDIGKMSKEDHEKLYHQMMGNV